MQKAQVGDRVHVHYVKRLQDGSMADSRRRAALEITVGSDHPRLPGLGLALVGLAPGASVTIGVAAANAYGPKDPTRVHSWARSRFPKNRSLQAGGSVVVLDRQGRRRLVRILEVDDKKVIVDTNHRWAGQSLELEVELISIEGSLTGGRAGK